MRAFALALALFATPVLAAEGVLTAGVGSDVHTLDPTMDHAPISLHARLNLFDQLTEIAADGSAAPRLATTWESEPGAKAWTFTIRRNAKFHDGSPVTIDDVVWTYEKVLGDARSPVRTFLGMIDKVERAGDDRIRFQLKIPFAPFPRQVSLISIVPRQAYERLGPDRFSQAPVGSGPYKLVRWVKDDRIELEAFADYWAGPAQVKSAVLKPVPSDAARVSALLSGELDLVPALPPPMVERLTNRPGIKVETAAGYRVVYLGFNAGHPALASLELRRAIDLAIDREAITGRLLRGLAKPSGQIVAPVSFGFDPAVAPTKLDRAEARALVQKSGYKGEKIPFQFPGNNIAAAPEVAQAIAGYLGEVGINVELERMDFTAFYTLWAGRKLTGIHMFAFGPILLDADAPLTSIYATSGERGYLFDPRIDALIGQQRAEPDLAKRRALIGQIWRIGQETMPYAMLYNELQAAGLRDGVTWPQRADGIIRLREITKR